MSVPKYPDAPFVQIPREVHAICRSLTVHERRVIDVLIEEHMANGGKHNGDLMVPQDRLRKEISPSYLSAAINGCVRRGLLDVKRGTGRAPKPIYTDISAVARWHISGAALAYRARE
jgi:hypothetical protein